MIMVRGILVMFVVGIAPCEMWNAVPGVKRVKMGRMMMMSDKGDAIAAYARKMKEKEIQQIREKMDEG